MNKLFVFTALVVGAIAGIGVVAGAELGYEMWQNRGKK